MIIKQSPLKQSDSEDTIIEDDAKVQPINFTEPKAFTKATQL